MTTRSIIPTQLSMDTIETGAVLTELGRPEGLRAIEIGFPVDALNRVAELESWRKEIHRPIYHLHKWWAQRLGSVFRAILIGSLAPRESDIIQLFYSPVQFKEAIVFDPFMGSGTTIGEALKLGARAIGYEINPVAYFSVMNALRFYSKNQVLETFRSIEKDIANEIGRFYRRRGDDGTTVDVLYYFWVMQERCPVCHEAVDLFSSYVFASHAYPKRNPVARILCPSCGSITSAHYDADTILCDGCGHGFNPRQGPARRSQANCPFCRRDFPIAKTIRARGGPPHYRPYAKLVLTSEGRKEYQRIDADDLTMYEEASRQLAGTEDPYPHVPIHPGYNTGQVLNYGIRYWHQLFNARQLLCLSLLAKRIGAVTDEVMRDLFACFFSGVLEFNNMFTSYKGEGTGAVRHLFSHHILKPERMPIEANLWGTPKSSGSFSTMFKTRLLRALEYREKPFEIVPSPDSRPSKKLFGLSSPIGHDVAHSFQEFSQPKQLYLRCGDSAKTDLAAESVDVVVTDPPYFDNVNYSELADFFYVWQRFILEASKSRSVVTTRSPQEVQHADANVFAERLTTVWQECWRVLKKDGLLVFTYHHSRPEGWAALLKSVVSARFPIVATYPVKAEMSVAVPKQQAKKPIDVDVVFICRKRDYVRLDESQDDQQLDEILARSQEVARTLSRQFRATGARFGLGDLNVILYAYLVERLSRTANVAESLRLLSSAVEGVEEIALNLWREQAQ